MRRYILLVLSLLLITSGAWADSTRDVVSNYDDNATDNPSLSNRLGKVIDLEEKALNRLTAIDANTSSLAPEHGSKLDQIHNLCLSIQEDVGYADGTDTMMPEVGDGSSTYRKQYRLALTLESVADQLQAFGANDCGMTSYIAYQAGRVDAAINVMLTACY